MQRPTYLLFSILCISFTYAQSNGSPGMVIIVPDGEIRLRIAPDEHLVVDHWHQAVRVKQDRIPLTGTLGIELDPANDPQAIVFTCPTHVPRCMTTEHFRMNTLRKVSAIDLSVPGSDALNVREALLRLMQGQASDLAATTSSP